MKVVIVTGGRRFGEAWCVHGALDEENPDLVIHGGAKVYIPNRGSVGADHYASEWAILHDVPQLIAPYIRSLGKPGGPVRNSWMVNFGHKLLTHGIADTLKMLAFPGGTGTADTVRKGELKGIDIRRVECTTR